MPDRAGARDDAYLIALWLAGCGSPHTQRAYVRDVAARLAWVPQSDRLAERILPEGNTRNLIHAAGAHTPQGRRSQALLQLLYYTGARVAVTCALRWRDLRDIEGRPPGRGHSRQGRTRSGRALLPRAAGEIIKAAAVKSGLTERVSPHWLRMLMSATPWTGARPYSGQWLTGFVCDLRVRDPVQANPR